MKLKQILEEKYKNRSFGGFFGIWSLKNPRFGNFIMKGFEKGKKMRPSDFRPSRTVVDGASGRHGSS